MPARSSDAVFKLLTQEYPDRLALLSKILVALVGAAVRRRDPDGNSASVYLNVGHTGLGSSGLDFWLSAKRLSPIIFVHDLIPITHPQFCRAGADGRHRRRIDFVLAHARGVIVNSGDTRCQLRDYARQSGLPMPPVTVAPLGIEPDLLRSPQEQDAPPHPLLPGRPWFLCVGTIEGRKNHRLLLDVWDKLRATLGVDAPDLVLVGRRGWRAQDVWNCLDQPGAEHGRVIEWQDCDDLSLRRLMSGASALLMPSHAEGYGLPVVEALALGTPVIASDLPAFRESAGEAPIYRDPHDVKGWVDAIIKIARRPAQANRAPLIAPPEWETHFRIVTPWMAELARGRPRRDSGDFVEAGGRWERACLSTEP